MIAARLLIVGLLLTPALAQATLPVKDFTEERAESTALESKYKKQSLADLDSVIMGSARQNYQKFTHRVTIPGYISAAALPEIAEVVGPADTTTSYRIGDKLYLRWMGAPGPREGDRYTTYDPALVLQNLDDPTDFQIRGYEPRSPVDLPKGLRLAGHFYEGTGTIRIVRVRRGAVEAVLEGISGQVSLGDRLMPLLPTKTDIPTITGGIQLAAAVVSGSPADRLSTTTRSFIYINRGARDGIRVGRMFQAVENVALSGPVAGPAPEISMGEAIVVHVTDSYSTAMITSQFDVVRIGSLLKTKQDLNSIAKATPFDRFLTGTEKAQKPATVPNLEEIREGQDPSLPEPTLPAVPSEESPMPDATKARMEDELPLSELDSIERSMRTKALSAEEKSRLGKLSRQQRLDAEADEEDAGDEVESTTNSFSAAKPGAKPKAKKRASVKKNSEEELNLLMMEN